ncbi:MAG: tetratricopeptide repeat-containing glycosyltransferase family protein [Burkholderiaceae bacterium]|nr:tetratricopeptide repeat-containing glycosyltransferase family protein [Burkholderiaceae bacterium]
MTSQADVQRVVGLIAQAIALSQNQHGDDALRCLNDALAIAPDFPVALVQRGTLLQSMGRHREAIADFDRCLAQKPDMAHVLAMRDAALQAEFSRLDHAASQPSASISTLYERALLLLRLQRGTDALTAFQQVLERDACHIGALIDMGNLLVRMHRHDESLACYERVLAVDPCDVIALFNRGNVLQKSARYREALASYDAALAHKPGFAEVVIEQAHCHLALGELQAGWPLFEARWDTEQLRRAKLQTAAPMWRGEVLDNTRVLLLWAEQGLGDTLQFVRYLPLIAQRASRIVLRVPTALQSLIDGFAARVAAASGASCASIAVVSNLPSLPAHDLHCPLMSLPLVFGSDLQSLPANVPYLHAPEASVEKWRNVLGERSKPRIGIVWAGGQRLLNNPTRDMPLRTLLPLFAYDAEWFSLQQSISAADAAILAQLPQVRCVGDDLADFADTAGLVAQLDLLVSIDSSVAHLAGALGKPVWLMLRKAGEWRWLHGRTDSPWYPKHRIFRQQSHGAWESVVRDIGEQLQVFAQD